MYQKFIINQDGVLKFGRVYQHCDLLEPGEKCPYGGGLWKMDEERGAVLLYGRSFAFGPPDTHYIKKIDWHSLGKSPCPLFFLPLWPNEEQLVPVIAQP